MTKLVKTTKKKHKKNQQKKTICVDETLMHSINITKLASCFLKKTFFLSPPSLPIKTWPSIRLLDACLIKSAWSPQGKTHKLLQVCVQVVTNLFTSCRQVVFALLVPSCCNKFGTSCSQLLTSLMALSDLLQGCSNKSDTVMVLQECHKVDDTRL